MEQDNQYLSIAQAAQALGIQRAALYQAIEAGRITPVLVMGKKAFRAGDVEAFREKMRPQDWRDNQRPH